MSSVMVVLVLIGTLLASLAPLSNALYVWQLKEWRWDRLIEHLRHERSIRSLTGIKRPTLIAIFIALHLSPIALPGSVVLSTFLVLAALSLIEIASRRVPQPVWTQKALALGGLSFVINLIAIYATIYVFNASTIWLWLSILAQPLWLSLAWLLLWPEDYRRKQQILQRARYVREQYPDLTVIGVTGSVGKTTTKELLAHVLSDFEPLVTPEHVNSELGVAGWLVRTLQKSSSQPKIAIIEMGAYKPGEIAKLCSMTQPQIGVITYIGTQHLALFGSKEALCKAKSELFAALPKTGHAFLNADCALSAKAMTYSHAPVTTVGVENQADALAYDIKDTKTGIEFRFDDATFSIPLHGSHNVTNVLLTILVAEWLGLSRAEIATKLSTFQPPAKTFTIRTEGDITILDDTHNCSAESFRAAIAWAKQQSITPRVLLTSGLIELGTAEHEIHRELGTLAKDVFDRVIFLDDHSRPDFAAGFGKPVESYSKQALAIESGSLLVCEGRVSSKIIQSLAPNT